MTDAHLMEEFDEDDHFPLPVDAHGNGPVDDDHWDHDACWCGHESWTQCRDERADAEQEGA